MSRIQRRAGRALGRRRAILWVSLLLLPGLATPERAEAERARPEPERVYQQLRRDPAIRSREEALEYLAGASPSELRRSAKLSVDQRIKDVLSHEGFDSLHREIRDSLDDNMLGVRSSFWNRDMDQLSQREEALRELRESGKIVSAARKREAGEELQDRVGRLVEEIQMALALESCTRVREQRGWGPADWLECLLNNGPDD
jgi:hypothetical protein